MVAQAAMALFAHLLGGTWSCTTLVPATGSTPPHTDRSIAAFTQEPGGVVHDRITASDYAGDFYIGYDPRSARYWLTGVDTLGTSISLVSQDGLHYDGTASMGGVVMKDSATYTNVSANETHAREVFTRPGVQAIFETVCTRS